jgi:hypothetical protein
MKTYMRFCESFAHILLNITRSEKCTEKTNVTEEERDTQIVCSISFVLALRLLRQPYVKCSEIEGILGNTIGRSLIFPFLAAWISRVA